MDPNTQPTQEPQETTPGQEPTISNSDIKSSQLFRGVTGELASTRKELEELRAGIEEQKRQAEIEEAKRKEDYDSALRLEKEAAEAKILEMENKAAEASKKALQMELKSALMEKGANPTKGLLAVAMAEYGAGEHESLDAFVSGLKESEDYSSFFGSEKQTFQKPPAAGGGDGAGSFSIEKINAMRLSGDSKQQAEAADMLLEYQRIHRKLPEGLTKRR
jgi:hypothetical protein